MKLDELDAMQVVREVLTRRYINVLTLTCIQSIDGSIIDDQEICDRWLMINKHVIDDWCSTVLWSMIGDQLICDRWLMITIYVIDEWWSTDMWSMIDHQQICGRWLMINWYIIDDWDDQQIWDRWLIANMYVIDDWLTAYMWSMIGGDQQICQWGRHVMLIQSTNSRKSKYNLKLFYVLHMVTTLHSLPSINPLHCSSYELPSCSLSVLHRHTQSSMCSDFVLAVF